MSLRLRSVVFALAVVPLLGFGRTPKLAPNPAHGALQSRVDAILQFGTPPGDQTSGRTPGTQAWR